MYHAEVAHTYDPCSPLLPCAVAFLDFGRALSPPVAFLFDPEDVAWAVFSVD